MEINIGKSNFAICFKKGKLEISDEAILKTGIFILKRKLYWTIKKTILLLFKCAAKYCLKTIPK